MLGRVCYWIFNMSIIATFMGLLVLLIRRFKGIPRRILVFLWAVPFLRMCFPLGINSKYRKQKPDLFWTRSSAVPEKLSSPHF